jgi:hypothetical protein
MVVRGIIAPFQRASQSRPPVIAGFFFFSPRQAENVLGHCAAVPRDFPALLEPSIARSLTASAWGVIRWRGCRSPRQEQTQEALCTSRV